MNPPKKHVLIAMQWIYLLKTFGKDSILEIFFIRCQSRKSRENLGEILEYFEFFKYFEEKIEEKIEKSRRKNIFRKNIFRFVTRKMRCGMCLSTHRATLKKVWKKLYVGQFFYPLSNSHCVYVYIRRGKSEISGPRRACSHRKCAFGATTDDDDSEPYQNY